MGFEMLRYATPEEIEQRIAAINPDLEVCAQYQDVPILRPLRLCQYIGVINGNLNHWAVPETLYNYSLVQTDCNTQPVG